MPVDCHAMGQSFDVDEDSADCYHCVNDKGFCDQAVYETVDWKTKQNQPAPSAEFNFIIFYNEPIVPY